MKLIFSGELTGADWASLYVRRCWEAYRAKAIANVVTEMCVLETGAHQFPVTINTAERKPGNCYVVSPSAAFTDYAREEVRRIAKPWLTWPLVIIIEGLRLLLRSIRIDEIVQVNNWLLSTNIYPPDWKGENLAGITRLLVERFPSSAIAFRSLNPAVNRELIEQLKAHGYVSIPTRQVYVYDGRDASNLTFTQHHNYKMDALLLQRSPYRRVPGHELREEDFARLEELYKLLYLDKYSFLNPQYSAQWLRQGQEDGWLELCALRREDGQIDGVVGWFENGEVITAPVVGYDTRLPQKAGLYRQLTQLCLQRALTEKKILNFSSGAARFKRLRGGQPEIEYSLVQVKHLAWPRRTAWKALSAILHLVAVPFMKKMEL